MTALVAILRRPPGLAWLALVAATGVSAALGDGIGPGRVAAVCVLAVAFLKIRVVGRYFMELRAAPPPLRWVFDLWAVVVCTALVTIYLTGA
jgi:hypothetical protein